MAEVDNIALEALQDRITNIEGVSQAVVLQRSPEALHAFVVLHCATAGSRDRRDSNNTLLDGQGPAKRPCLRRGEISPFRVLAAVRHSLPEDCQLHIISSFPLQAGSLPVDRGALESKLQALEDLQQCHLKAQAAFEDQVAKHYQNWGRMALAVACLPEVLSSIVQEPRAPYGTDIAWCFVRLCRALFTRLLVLPELWVTCLYLEQQQLLPACVAKFFAMKGRVCHVLPLLSAAFLPRDALLWMLAAAVAYLSLARERNFKLALSLGGLVSAFALQSFSTAAVSLLLAATCADTAEMMRFLAASHASCFQMLPKELADDLGALIERHLHSKAALKANCFRSFLEWLRPPRWEGFLRWSAEAAIVDCGNTWKDVYLEGQLSLLQGHKGQSAWNSTGLTVHLHPSRLEEPGVAAALEHGACNDASPCSGRNDAEARSLSPESLQEALRRLLGRICCRSNAHSCFGDESLHGLDSLQALQLAEAIRHDLGRNISVPEILTSSCLSELCKVVEGRRAEALAVEPSTSAPNRVWLCSLGRLCVVDWMARRPASAQHLDVPALQRALNCLVARHPGLRARNVGEEALFHTSYNAAALWQLWCANEDASRWTHSLVGQLISASVWRSWPRTALLPPCSNDAVQLLVPTLREVLCSEDGWGQTCSEVQRAFWVGAEVLRRVDARFGTEARDPIQSLSFAQRRQQPLFHLCVIPMLACDVAPQNLEEDAVSAALRQSPEKVTWYIYAVLDHGYCDGPAGLPLLVDLLRLYGLEAGEACTGRSTASSSSSSSSGGGSGSSSGANVSSAACSDSAAAFAHPSMALQTLEGRLQQSLKALPEALHPNADILHDGLHGFGWRQGYQRFVRFDTQLMHLLRFAAHQNLGCSVDVAWLTAISVAFLRSFPDLHRLDLYLIVPGRDAPGEESMIGYFCSRKLLPIDLGDPACVPILGLSDLISSARKQRSWRRARPFEKFGAIEINIVSMLSGVLPCGFQEVRYAKAAPSSWHRGGSSNLTLRLDQISEDDWDFRLQCHDASFGMYWSTYYVQALGSALVDMAIRPLSPVVPSAGVG